MRSKAEQLPAWILWAFIGYAFCCFTGKAAEIPWAAQQPLSKITGMKKNLGLSHSAKHVTEFTVPVSELPEFFDWRFYASGLTPIRRQINSDCWAQGSTGIVENLVRITSGAMDPLSVQQTISCSGAGSASSGGNWALAYFKRFGLVPEAQFPYVGQDVRCKSGLQPKYRLKDWGFVGERGQRPTTAQIKQAMMEYGVLGNTVYANSALQRYQGTQVFSGCGNGGTNHITMLVGWEPDTKGGHWLMRNSWGTTHGDQGYARMPFNCSRVDEEVVYAVLEEQKADGSWETIRPLELLRQAGAI